MTAPTLLLNDGNRIPQLGLGTWPLSDAEVAPVVVAAIEAGYRHIDTAYRYGNERGVGQGIRDSGIRREELFVTTKLDGAFQGNDRAIAGLDECLQRLGLDYVDLLLIHWPLPQRDEYVSTWKTFEQLVAAGAKKGARLRECIDMASAREEVAFTSRGKTHAVLQMLTQQVKAGASFRAHRHNRRLTFDQRGCVARQVAFVAHHRQRQAIEHLRHMPLLFAPDPIGGRS